MEVILMVMMWCWDPIPDATEYHINWSHVALEEHWIDTNENGTFEPNEQYWSILTTPTWFDCDFEVVVAPETCGEAPPEPLHRQIVFFDITAHSPWHIPTPREHQPVIPCP